MSLQKPTTNCSAKKPLPAVKPLIMMDMRRCKPKVKPKIPPMDQRIKPNPKYDKVQPVTDTGNNLRKQLERIEEMRQYYRFRPDEIFRRITVTSLVGLMVEVSKLEYQEMDLSRSDKPHPETVVQEAAAAPEASPETDGVENDPPKAAEPQPDDCFESVVFKGKMIKRSSSQHSQLHSSIGDLLQGIGGPAQLSAFRPHNQQVESSRAYHHQNSFNAASTFYAPDESASVAGSGSGSRKTSASEYYAESIVSASSSSSASSCLSSDTALSRPFLILDIREPEEFDKAHLVMAKNYPHNRLSRAANFETKDMLYFKNKEGKLIVVYDYDESLSHKFATTLIQRGYDNIFMLSGGLRVARLKFPDFLVKTSRGRKREDEQPRLSEEEIAALEVFLNEHNSSGSRSMYASTGKLNTLSLSSCMQIKPKNFGHSPIRMPMRSSSIGRS